MSTLLIRFYILFSFLLPCALFAHGYHFLSQGREVISIGDLHGRLDTFKKVLSKAGVVDRKGEWMAHDVIVVQVGDVLDKGREELELIRYMEKLRQSALLYGSEFLWLIGNHEMYNLDYDFTHVAKKGFSSFYSEYDSDDSYPEWLYEFSRKKRGRVVSLIEGELFSYLEHAYAAVIIDETLYVHASITSHFLTISLKKMNREVREYIRGTVSAKRYFYAQDGPFESRYFTKKVTKEKCHQLKDLLNGVGVKRVVVGHTKQKKGIQSLCKQRIWMIDSNISSWSHGEQEALSIQNNRVDIIR